MVGKKMKAEKELAFPSLQSFCRTNLSVDHLPRSVKASLCNEQRRIVLLSHSDYHTATITQGGDTDQGRLKNRTRLLEQTEAEQRSVFSEWQGVIQHEGSPDPR